MAGATPTRRRRRGGARHGEAGADLIDVGGESTRPGASPLSAADEGCAASSRSSGGWPAGCRVPISIDTYKADVAAAALDLGATIVNDISGLRV